ncbi:MAG: aminoacyl-tRNA hydrolase [Rhodospirillales bacterium]|nr:aminoacyl-tRNA hydrolase [Rhodospirillales bacterium]
MHLLVGLGNPGTHYAYNRHNIGFLALDDIVERHGFQPWRKGFQGQVAEGRVGGKPALALKPQTFMNESGRAVGAALGFYKLKNHRAIVFHDELDLAPGRVRAKLGGGAGGHNGIRSIDAHIGKDYWRVRLGIGHPGQKHLVNSHVLNNFAKADEGWLDPLLEAVASELPILLNDGHEAYMSKVAHLAPAPKSQTVKTAAKDSPPKPGQGRTIFLD